jgi:hypothetical protein
MSTKASTFDIVYTPTAVDELPPAIPFKGGPGRPANPELEKLAEICKTNPGTWFLFATLPNVSVGDQRRVQRVASNLRTGMQRRGVKTAQRKSDDGNEMRFYASYQNGTAA